MTTEVWDKTWVTYTIWWLSRFPGRFYGWLLAKAAKNKIEPKYFIPLYLFACGVFYYGLIFVLPHNFVLGVSIMASSYLFDYGYILVLGEPEWTILVWLGIVATIDVASLSHRVGFWPALLSVGAVALILVVARFIRGRCR